MSSLPSASKASKVSFSVDTRGLDHDTIVKKGLEVYCNRLEGPFSARPLQREHEDYQPFNLRKQHLHMERLQFQLVQSQAASDERKLGDADRHDTQIKSLVETINTSRFGQLSSPLTKDLEYMNANLKSQVDEYLGKSDFNGFASTWKAFERAERTGLLEAEMERIKSRIDGFSHRWGKKLGVTSTGDSQDSLEMKYCVLQYARDLLRQESLPPTGASEGVTTAPPAYAGPSDAPESDEKTS